MGLDGKEKEQVGPVGEREREEGRQTGKRRACVYMTKSKRSDSSKAEERKRGRQNSKAMSVSACDCVFLGIVSNGKNQAG